MAVLCIMQEYVMLSQATIKGYISTRLIYEICTWSERFQGVS